MYRIDGNILEIGEKTIHFRYPVRNSIGYHGRVIVLVGIPFEDTNTINNIVCYASDGELIWQVEDMKKRYPDWGVYAYQPYEGMGIDKGIIYASTFNGWCYHIDPENGKLLGYHFTK